MNIDMPIPLNKPLLIGPFSQLLPMSGIRLRGPLQDNEMPVLENAGLMIENGRIHSIGPFDKLRSTTSASQVIHIRLEADCIGLPGFIDAHTHLCFAGSRARDYALRNSGRTYQEISRAGGGIWDTVTQTRNASREELTSGISQRAWRHLCNGVTTLEIKSGYGLSQEEELKMLLAIQDAKASVIADLIPTCLAAHMVPRDFTKGPDVYLKEISDQLFPILKAQNLANRIDAFIEEGAFSPENIRPYFEKARSMGFDLTVHADQFTTGGSEVAVLFGAKSADHLEVSTNREIKLLARSQVIATALPGASMGLGCGFTPARKILDAGGALAIASDHNPGSAPMGDLLTQAAVLGAFEKLTAAEVFAALTVRASAALGLKDRGQFSENCLADLLIFRAAHYHEILYHQGTLKPFQVYKKGALVYENPQMHRYGL